MCCIQVPPGVEADPEVTLEGRRKNYLGKYSGHFILLHRHLANLSLK